MERKKIIGVDPHGGRQVRKLRKDAGWTDPAKQEVFLAHLAMTCNVTEAAACIKLSRRNGYMLRRNDAEFRARWDAAIDEGRLRLWGELLAQASREMKPLSVSPGDGDALPVDTKLALDLLKLHAAGRAPFGGFKAPHRPPMSADELRIVIFQKLQDKRRELGGGDA